MRELKLSVRKSSRFFEEREQELHCTIDSWETQAVPFS